MIADIEKHIIADMSVEAIQDLVEETLMKHGYLQVAKAIFISSKAYGAAIDN